MHLFSKLASLLLLAVYAANGQGQFFRISTLAGSDPIGDGGPATAARLWTPEVAVVDGQGNTYIADGQRALIYRVAPNGTLRVLAGGGLDPLTYRPGLQATSALLGRLTGMVVDARGERLYFSDELYEAIGLVDLVTGEARLFAGTPLVAGAAGDGGPAAEARFSSPAGLALEANGNLLIADRGNHRIRRITLSDGRIETVAGGSAGFAGDNGPARNALLRSPRGVAVGADGAIYVADWGNGRIRKITATAITTVAGNGSTRYSGDGVATASAVDGRGVAVAADGTIYIADEAFHRVRRLDATGRITSLVGSEAAFAGDGGPLTNARLRGPVSVTVVGTGSLLICDRGNYRVRQVNLQTSRIQTLAGRSRFGGDGGPAAEALASLPWGVVIDGQGNILFADSENHCVRRIGRDGRVTTVAGIPEKPGRGLDAVQATASELASPLGLALDTDGSLYIADWGNGRMRVVEPSGVIRTVVGETVLDPYYVHGITIDTRNRFVYFTDDVYHQVLRWTIGATSTRPTLVAGSPQFRPGFGGDGGQALSALLNRPAGITLAGEDLIFADQGNARVRRIDANGVIRTIAGNGRTEIPPRDGAATSVGMFLPEGVAVDASGRVYVTELGNRVRRIANGQIESVTSATQTTGAFGGDGGLAQAALVNSPTGIVMAPNGAIVFADSFNHRIRQLAPIPAPTAARIRATAGDGQRAQTGTVLPQALRVRVSSQDEIGVPGVTVNFLVTRGAARLSAESATTDASGEASVTVTLGETAGAVQVSAAATGLTPALFNLTATAPPVVVPRPAIGAGGVVGVANSVPAVRRLSPGGLISIYGQNFLPAGVAGRGLAGSDIVDGQLPTSLLNTCVEIGTTRAFLLAVFPGQINAQVPQLSGTSAAVRVRVNCGQANELVSEAETVPVVAAAPEFLYAQLNADGRNPVVAVNAVTGGLVGPSNLPGFREAAAGDVLTLYATGFGPTNPAVTPGTVPVGVASVAAPVRVRIGETELSAGDILYAGFAPGLVIYQVNIRVPAGLAAGNQTIQVVVGEAVSPAGAFLAIQ